MNAPTPTPATTQPRPAAKHTPGPWILDYDKGTTQDILSRKHGGICTVRRAGRHDNETFAANARLIAAAPELLSALRQTLDALEIAHEYASKTAPALACVKWAETKDAARSAIAQAEGGAQ